MAGFVNDWPRLFMQCYAALKPGGYIELQDFHATFLCDNGSLSDDSILHQWVKLWEAGATQTGRQWLTVVPNLKNLIESTGFVDVVEIKTKVPIGRWPKDEKHKEIGMCMLKQFVEGAEGITLGMFTRVLAWDMTQVDGLLDKVKKEVMNPKVHSFIVGYIVYARKPLVAQ